MTYDDWKTTDPRDKTPGPDYGVDWCADCFEPITSAQYMATRDLLDIAHGDCDIFETETNLWHDIGLCSKCQICRKCISSGVQGNCPLCPNY